MKVIGAYIAEIKNVPCFDWAKSHKITVVLDPQLGERMFLPEQRSMQILCPSDIRGDHHNALTCSPIINYQF